MCRPPQAHRRKTTAEVAATTNDGHSSPASKAPQAKATNGHVDADKPRTRMHRPLQLAFLLLLVAPPLLAARADPAGLRATRRWLLTTWHSVGTVATTWRFLAASLCLSVERLCYTWVWCFTGSFLDFCAAVTHTWLRPTSADTPVDVIVRLFKVNKFFQYGGFAWFYLAAAPFPSLRELSLFQAVTGLALILIGQILNIGIYAAIGKKGVYYGCKFGQHAEWCTGFPFNVVAAHPQYVGSVATTLGAVLLLATDAVVDAGWFALAAVQAAMYAYMAYVEHHL